ncbi:alanine aminotransferase 2-like [Danio aesculapii]|uniref:alanine aminotransferase 2-like n=1 Tax=Danio aesculapii TaxID=1142201 RepID=UPI0024C0B861|nr:alanine aminotransferase 2-like [Danio aesculapii]
MEKTTTDTSAEVLKVIDLSSGDSHSAGIKPITFVRQVITGCLYPRILQGDTLPPDARQRAQTLLQQLDGGSAGSYTESCGSMYVRNTIARSISLRDGGVLSRPDGVFITADTQRALMVMLRLLCQSEGVSAVMIPDPAPHTLARLIDRVGIASVPYRLQETSGWSLERAELNKAIQASRVRCSPQAIYISNPGNPTGAVQSRESIEDVIRFAHVERLFLLVNEGFSLLMLVFCVVLQEYQNTVFADGCEFVSYKRVLAEMDEGFSQSVQLASLHSLSNGIMGECGLRTSFMELVNLDEDVMLYTEVLLTGDLCPAVIGQIALDVMMAPPHPGDPSYSLYIEEVSSRLKTLQCNVSRAVSFINDLPGFSCQSTQGGVFICPQLSLPHSTHTHSQPMGLLYSRRLLEDQGVCVGFSEDHTHSHCCHFRLCVLMPSDELEEVLRRLQCFHLKFLQEY